MKYVHFLMFNDIKFYLKTYNMINNVPDVFNPEEHLFVTPYKNVYDALENGRENLIYTKKTGADIVNYYGKNADWIFMHNLNLNSKEVLKIKKSVAKKIIWRTWGADIKHPPVREDNSFFMWPLKLIGDRLYINKIRQFYGVGIGFKYDRVAIENRFGKMNCFIMPLDAGSKKGSVYKAVAEAIKPSDTLRIMVGHSGYLGYGHAEALKALTKFKNEKIKICLVLSYGKPEDIKEIKKLAAENFKQEQIEIIEDFMGFDDYIRYLSKIDVAIFGHMGSAALGNIMSLIYFHKKLIVREKSLIDKALTEEGIEHYHIKDIDKMSFGELAAPIKTIDEMVRFAGYKEDNDYTLNIWKNILRELTENKEESVDING